MSQTTSCSIAWRRYLIRFVAFPVVLGAVLLGVLMIFENRMVFFPTRALEDWHEPADLEKQDVSLTTADGTNIHAWWCPRNETNGAVLFCHGNGGNLSGRVRSYRSLLKEQNMSVMAFDYPGYGKSAGRPSEAGCYAAAQAAFDWLTTEQRIAAERIVLFGESLGGGVATELATRRPCRALILFSTFTSVPGVGHDHYPFLPVRTLMRNRFDSRSKIRGLTRPVFIAHGEADQLISPDHAQRLYEAAAGPKAIHLDPGREHDGFLRPEFHAALRAFLKAHAP